MSTLQTLDRGLRALEYVSQHPGGVTIADLATELDIARAIGYRIVATLEEHALVVRTSDGRIQLAAGAAVLGSRFASKLRAVAQPQLRELAKRARATAFLSVTEHDECVVVTVAEPEEGMLRVGYRVGSRHPIDQGAAGIAVLASRPESPNDSEDVRQARRAGYSLTRGQIEHGAVGIAAGLRSPLPPDAGGFECSIGVVAIDGLDTASAAAAVVDAASRIKADMGI